MLPNDKAERLTNLCTYIKENQKNIINYNAHKEQGLPFISSYIIAVDDIINDRQARTKNAWTRDGAHNVVQIKSSRASNSCGTDWQNALNILIAA